MSRQNRHRPSRKEHRKQETTVLRRNRLIRIGIIALVAAVLLGAIIFRFVGTSVAGIIDYGTQERGHDEGVIIESGQLPPVGGVHSPRWQNCGVYDRPVDNKNAVHSMEHGAVWITYQPELAGGDVSKLRDLIGDTSYLLLSPYPGLNSPVVLSAWGIQLELDSADDERAADFINTYRLGPQTPEFGAGCTGGVGLPMS